MHRLIRWSLYSILALVVLVWLALGLIKPEYLKGPLVAWIQQETGLPLEIGKLNYNPIYPNILLAENVTLGPDMKVDKIYVEVAEGSWWQRKIRLAHLDLVHPQIKWQTGLTLPQPFRQIDIDDLTINQLSLKTDQFSMDGGSLHLKNWQPVLAGEWQPWQTLNLKASFDAMTLGQTSIGQTQFTGTIADKIVKLDEFNTSLLGGALTTRLIWDQTQNTLQLQDTKLANLRLDLAALPALPVAIPQVTANQIALENVSAIQLNERFALNNASGVIKDLSWQPSQRPTFSYQGSLGEFTQGLFQVADMSGEGNMRTTSWSLKVKGNAYAGTFATEVESDGTNQTLTIDSLQLDKMQAELYAGWKERLAALPYRQIDLGRADFSGITLISFDDSVPLTVKGFDLFLTDLRWTPEGLETTNHKARLEADWLELVWKTLVSRKAEVEASLENQQITLEKLNAQLEDSPLSITGQWSFKPDGQHQLTTTLKQFDLEQLSDMLGPRYPFAGKANLDLQFTSSGKDWASIQQHLNGQLELFVQDLYVDGLKLDPYLDNLLTPETPDSQSLEQITGKLRGGDTFFNHANLKIQAADGKLNSDGSAFESITHLIGLKQGFDLNTKQWNLQLSMLNDEGLSELNSSLAGSWDAPQLKFSLPSKNEKHWVTAPVKYPPQGKNGVLRE